MVSAFTLMEGILIIKNVNQLTSSKRIPVSSAPSEDIPRWYPFDQPERTSLHQFATEFLPQTRSKRCRHFFPQ